MITLEKFIKAITDGSQILSLEREYINNLNVFPVPDGDTGSNMDSTIRHAIEFNIKNKNITSFHEFATLFPRGLLMNARGNSGVIFSQIMRGFFSNFDETIQELTPSLLKESFVLAKDKAYSSVVNPIEGTILTVIRIIAEQINPIKYNTIKDLFHDVIKYGEEALASTPDLLPDLKEVGVVDSGGYGLMSFLKGVNASLNDTFDDLWSKTNEELKKNNANNQLNEENFKFFNDHKNEQGFGYCSEVIINLNLNINPKLKESKEQFYLEKFKNELLKIGDSLVCVQDSNYVKVHIHTMKPNLLLQLSQKYGEFEKIKIENMSLQYEEKVANSINADTAINELDNITFKPGLVTIATAPTQEIADILTNEFGIKKVIITDDKIAPSLQTFLNEIYKAEKQNCLIIVDNSNLALTVAEAKRIVSKKVECEIIVAQNIFETIVVASNISNDDPLKTILKEAHKSLKSSLSAVISTSIKDVSYSHINVEKDNKIGIINKKIVVSTKNEYKALQATLDKLMKKQKDIDICYLIYGANADLDAMKKFESYASEKYGLYCEIKKGNQNVYDYYIGLQ